MAALLALLALPVVLGHAGCGAHEIGRRNPGGRMIEKRQATEASTAMITDPTLQCAPYSYAPVYSALSSYPPIWQIADLVAGDTAAATAFATVNASINARFPNTKPRGTPAGDLTGVVYNTTDPDCWWSYQHCTTPSASLGLQNDITTVPEPNTWGLSFDDGPNCSHNAFYDYLRDQGQKATLFYIGSNLMDWPLQGMRALADGHEVCVHTWSHRFMTSLTNQQAFAELYYTKKAFELVLGVTPKCWRAASGDIDNRIRAIAEAVGLTSYYGWSDDSADWRIGTGSPPVTQANIDANYQSVITKQKAGNYNGGNSPIVLTHELNNFTMSEFISWYPSLKSNFSHIVPLAAAYNLTTPYVETNITFPNFAQYIANSSAAAPPASTTAVSSTASSMSSSVVSSSMVSSTSASVASAAATTKASSAGRTVGAAMGGMGVVVVGVGMMMM